MFKFQSDILAIIQAFNVNCTYVFTPLKIEKQKPIHLLHKSIQKLKTNNFSIWNRPKKCSSNGSKNHQSWQTTTLTGSITGRCRRALNNRRRRRRRWSYYRWKLRWASTSRHRCYVSHLHPIDGWIRRWRRRNDSGPPSPHRFTRPRWRRGQPQRWWRCREGGVLDQNWKLLAQEAVVPQAAKEVADTFFMQRNGCWAFPESPKWAVRGAVLVLSPWHLNYIVKSWFEIENYGKGKKKFNYVSWSPFKIRLYVMTANINFM